MRKAQKEQLLSFLKLLEQAHIQIANAVKQENRQLALRLLNDCQDGAAAFTGLMKRTEDKEAPAISMMNEYRGQAHRISIRLAGNKPVNADKVCRSLQEFLIKVKDSVEHGIPVRREVVFLPYKASMWDSLESVWRAADEDPECDAYVIPIPYYDKNPDGSFREIHYEGKEYPKDVPVTWYKAYHFEERRPDVIFIHNPYDECNYVTSVEPFFYAKNLKQYTDMLVYIPYFILGEIDPDNEEAVKGVEHFCTTPGVIYADKVVVQSESMRQIYIKIMTKFAGESTRSMWEQKILGLGSPKLDKVANTKLENVEIPGEWRRIIQKKDGSRKKIIFYNTSVAALLEHNEKMLKKMQDVFQVFYENRESTALLWRPHPLTEATIRSMRPKLWEEYKKIVEKYKEEGWGIYDDTADLNRAIAISDGYYGDGSSVVQLCQKAGIPVMYQNVDV